MKIYILEDFIKQTHKTSFSRNTLNQIYKEFDRIIEAEKTGFNSLKQYLNKNNDKELKGSENIYKFRLNDGDRILYTWGRYLSYIDNPNSMVLIAYATHDKQGNYKTLPAEQKYVEVNTLVQDKNELTDEDIIDLCDSDYTAFVQSIFEKDYQNNHAIYVVDDETLKQADLDELDVILSKEQSEIIDSYLGKQKPTLILGGAGTGKTVMAIHLLDDIAIDDDRYGYFTQSEALREKAKKRYENLRPRSNIDNIKFTDINKFCREVTGLRDSNLIETTQFLTYVRNTEYIQMIIKKHSFTELDLWTEIRGVIKGQTDDAWKRSKLKNQNDYAGDAIKKLSDNKFIVREKTNPQLFTLSKDYKSLDKDNLDKKANEILNELISYYESFDTSVCELTRKQYLELSDENTMIARENREIIYDIYEQYKRWLVEDEVEYPDWTKYKDSYDDNDLARLTIEKIKQGEIEKFKFLVVDEIQDYTEMQIYLLSLLVEDKKNIVFAGDIHQIINPTLFNERKVTKLFNNELVVRALERNFRCPKNIVDFGNELAKIRREKIASKKNEGIEYSDREGKEISILQYTESNIYKIIQYLLDYPHVAILVPEKSIKDELIKGIGTDLYDQACNNIIYSISEIKGMEYKYVVTFDILSKYDSTWEAIMAGTSKQVTRFRYFFNLFYVAITRSQQKLCILEKNNRNKLLEYILNKIEHVTIDDFDIEKLDLNILTRDVSDWLADAKDNENAGLYQRAIDSYKRAGAPNIDIWRCQAKLAIENKKYGEAIKYFVLLNETKQIIEYIEDLDSNSPIYRFAKVYVDINQYSLTNEYTKDYFISAINDLYNDYTDELKSELLFKILNKVNSNLIRMIENAN